MKQYIKVLFIAAFLMFVNSTVYSQIVNVKSSKVETIKGKTFYIHMVEKGQTLYGISKLYAVTVDEILEYNPEASTGLKKGMELRILTQSVPAKVPTVAVQTQKPAIKDTLSIEHVVKQGETLFSIAKQYEMTIEEIRVQNPLLGAPISIGDKIQISKAKKPNSVVQKNDGVAKIKEDDVVKPIEVATADTPNLSKSALVVAAQSKKQSITDSLFIEHLVRQGETFYSIARQYEMTVAEIRAQNPQLGALIAVGDKIRIAKTKKPIPVVQNSDVVGKIKEGVAVEPEVVPVVENPNLKVAQPVKVAKTFKGGYEVALLIPLYLSENRDVNNIKTLKDVDGVKSFSFIQFYESFLIALKQFEGKGVKLKLRVYDVENDTTKLNKLLNSSDFANVDLIVGPFFTNTFKVAARWAKSNQAFIINPFSNRNDLVVNNPYAVKMSPSTADEAAKIASYSTTHFPGANLLIVYNLTDTEKKMLVSLKQQFAKIGFKGVVKELIYSEKGINGVVEKLDTNRQNVVITLFKNEALVTNYIRRMYELKCDKIALFGVAEWMEYDNIETDYLEYLNLHYYQPFFADYKDEAVIDFVETFRSEYHTEPELSKYAFQGYDICTYFVGALVQYGYNWTEKMNEYHPRLISSKVRLSRKDENSGYENSEVQLFKLEDYRFVKAE